jgi:hypothetical protein
VTSEAQLLALHEGTRLKLKATALLAEGGDDDRFEACVLFHAAARAERRALLAVEAPTAEARLRVAIEVCGCLVDGLDPGGVLSAWGEVLEASEGIDRKALKALRARIDRTFAAFVRGYERVRAKTAPLWSALARHAPIEGALAPKVDLVLASYPGDALFWSLRSQLHFERGAGSMQAAWDAIRRARRLLPDDAAHRGWEIYLAACSRRPEAESLLDVAHAEARRGEAPIRVCEAFVAGVLALHEAGQSSKLRLQQARDVAVLGAGLADATREERKLLRAFQLIAEDLLAGRPASPEALYRAGLGHLVHPGTKSGSLLEMLAARTFPHRHAAAA